ncbi:ATP-binding protein [Flavobacterium undicola]|uniref:ATP-binding protein n=1 Tax=Flavobacterium undicola TaxID=1932779 RepID=UPI0013772AAB|nr:ATP-binding protein [Flavobacterium undicola]MBA0883009.1 ATP-binding protein [Flavobacterium undicola]
MIRREQTAYAKARLFKGKALLVFGPRQVGKTTFVQNLIADLNKKTLFLNGDESDVLVLFENPNVSKLKNIIGDNEILVIDEAQRITNIGIVLKIIVDQIKTVQVIATGSSSFELANKLNEPLTGRKYEMFLFPIAFSEMVTHSGLLEEKRSLEQRLIYGSYPEIVTNPIDAKEHIKLIANSYLYKDLFLLEQISKPVLLQKIVKALALQVGSEVNYNELGKLIQIDNKTVEKYIDLLEKAFVIFKLPALSNNVRNEIKKGKKIYFYDNGIINAVTANFNPLALRTDTGSLWENYIISERIKQLNIQQDEANSYFWRTTQQQEIDYIEKNDNSILACEIKWNAKTKYKIPVTFSVNYTNVISKIVSPENYEEFLLAPYKLQ